MGRDKGKVAFLSGPRAGCLLTMDTEEYSKWDDMFDGVHGGMNNGAALLAPLGSSLARGLGSCGRKEGKIQERGSSSGCRRDTTGCRTN